LLQRLGPVVRAGAAESRSQSRNRELALARLAARIDAGLRVESARTPTKPTKSSQVRRVEGKRRRGEVKRGRRPPRQDD
jgi:ribosome-associated protein